MRLFHKINQVIINKNRKISAKDFAVQIVRIYELIQAGFCLLINFVSNLVFKNFSLK